MGLGDTSDEWILAHVDDVCAVPVALTEHAMTIGDWANFEVLSPILPRLGGVS
jgi:hypothetical protein